MKFESIFNPRILSLIIIFVAGALPQASKEVRAIEVPFEFVKNEIVVHVRINGKGPFQMLLDTGTDPSAIDLNAAKEIGLKTSEVGQKGSGGGTSINLAYQTRLSLVELGGLLAKDVNAAAIDLSKLSERMGKTIHGVLGHSLLNKRIVQFDYPKNIVRFYERSPFPKTSEPNTQLRSTFPFRYRENLLIDDVWVNGKKLVGSLDTGASGNFDLTPAAIRELGLEAEVEKGEVASSVGYNGAFDNRKGHVKNVTIGGISVDSPAVTFFGKGTGHDNRPWGINIGNVFLKDFVVTIDYPAKSIRLERP